MNDPEHVQYTEWITQSSKHPTAASKKNLVTQVPMSQSPDHTEIESPKDWITHNEDHTEYGSLKV